MGGEFIGMTSFNEQVLRSPFSEEEYNQLLKFFQSIWMSDATYKIFMAPRAFNLNFAFMEILNAPYKDEYKTENIMSDTALLLCAEQITESFQVTGSFPRIILADDILIHGENMMKLIDSLENLILEHLKGKKNDAVSEQTIHNELIRAICIYAFAQNRESILLDRRSHRYTITCTSSRKLKSLSQKISRSLQQCGVANTSYSLSADLPRSFFQTECKSPRNLDTSVFFRYRGNKLHFYYKNHHNKALETIHIYYSDKSNLPKTTCTSLVILGDIPYQKDTGSAFHALCVEIADEIRRIIPRSRIADILSYPQQELARPKAQMLSYLLSILSYANFFAEKISSKPQLIYKALLQSNYPKIAANFDCAAKIKFEIVQLFSYISQNSGLSDRIFQILETRIQEPKSGESTVSATGWQSGRSCRSDSHEFAEDIFYEVGMNAEYSANQYIQTQTPFDPVKPNNDSIPFEQYLPLMQRREVNAIPSIGCALNLMDSSLLTVDIDLNRSQEAVQCILKAGELATFVLPRRFLVLVPALSIVERECIRKGSNPKTVVSQFLDFLQDYCYQENGVIRKEDVALLRKLRRSMLSLLYLYAAGQKFQDWNVELLTEEDGLSHGVDEQGNFNLQKYVSWMSSHSKRIRYYSYCAREFLRNWSETANSLL